MRKRRTRKRLFYLCAVRNEFEAGATQSLRFRRMRVKAAGLVQIQRRNGLVVSHDGTDNDRMSTDFTELKREHLARALRQHTSGEVRFDRASRRLYSTDASIYQ